MLSFLKNHPFAVEAFFEYSLVLTFAIPKDELLRLIPEYLTLDTFKDKWAFVAVAMVQTKGLRPKGFPEFMGNDFFLIGYRVFVRYQNQKGRNLRGLYILKSETNSKKMEFFGNIFTHYNYATIDIIQNISQNKLEFASSVSNFKVNISLDNHENIALPKYSPFNDWKEARRFAGPLPFTFTYNQKSREVLIIEGVREHWNPVHVTVLEHDFDFLRKLNFKEQVLANAFIIRDIPYYWKNGKIEKWN